MSEKKAHWKPLPEEIKTKILQDVRIKYIAGIIVQLLLAFLGFSLSVLAYNAVVENSQGKSNTYLSFILLAYLLLLVFPFIRTIPRKVAVLISLKKKDTEYTSIRDLGLSLMVGSGKKKTIALKGKLRYNIFVVNQKGYLVTDASSVMLVRPFKTSTSLYAIVKS